jgi:hypothetical protein
MIVSVHIADRGPRAAIATLRRTPSPGEVAGLLNATTALCAPIGQGARPPRLGPVALIAAWQDDAACEEFCASHPVAAELAAGWRVRLEPLRVYGAWSGMPGLPAAPVPHDESDPVAVLTIGHLRLRRAVPFLRASGPAEREALTEPALLASTALARPPHLVSTFSLWRSAAEMRDYAIRAGGRHAAALKRNEELDFHSESAFIRFRPYASSGSWGGRDPLAA